MLSQPNEPPRIWHGVDDCGKSHIASIPTATDLLDFRFEKRGVTSFGMSSTLGACARGAPFPACNLDLAATVHGQQPPIVLLSDLPARCQRQHWSACASRSPRQTQHTQSPIRKRISSTRQNYATAPPVPPFIKAGTCERVLRHRPPSRLRVHPVPTAIPSR